MTDISFAMEAKSDQLNAVDIMGADRTIKITRVDVRKGDQPVSVFFEGDHGRPWKPSKGMIRVLGAAWGTDSAVWAGRRAGLYFEPSVIYAGKPVGGIRIRSLSNIKPAGLQLVITINRQKREPYHVQFLDTTRPAFPDDRFENGFGKMTEMMQSGEKTLQQIISMCQKTGDLTPEQLTRLEQAAPVEINEDEQQSMPTTGENETDNEEL